MVNFLFPLVFKQSVFDFYICVDFMVRIFDFVHIARVSLFISMAHCSLICFFLNFIFYAYLCWFRSFPLILLSVPHNLYFCSYNITIPSRVLLRAVFDCITQINRRLKSKCTSF